MGVRNVGWDAGHSPKPRKFGRNWCAPRSKPRTLTQYRLSTRLGQLAGRFVYDDGKTSQAAPASARVGLALEANGLLVLYAARLQAPRGPVRRTRPAHSRQGE